MAGCTLVDSMNATELSQYRAPVLKGSVREMAVNHALNGRTIKNVVKTAQALALSSYVLCAIILKRLLSDICVLSARNP
jgi:hypothetical protein